MVWMVWTLAGCCLSLQHQKLQQILTGFRKAETVSRRERHIRVVSEEVQQTGLFPSSCFSRAQAVSESSDAAVAEKGFTC